MRNRSLVLLAFIASSTLACSSPMGGIGVEDGLGDAVATDSHTSADAPSAHDGKPPLDDSSPPPPPPPDSGTTSVDTGGVSADTGIPAADTAPPPSDDLQHCVDVLNGYRKKVGKPPLARSTALEAYATEGAKSDAASGTPHGHFTDTSGGGIAWAENEIPGWPVADSGSVRGVIDGGTQMMWDEGPGGGHYENIIGDYTEVGCGVFVTTSGDVWVTQDFK